MENRELKIFLHVYLKTAVSSKKSDWSCICPSIPWGMGTFYDWKNFFFGGGGEAHPKSVLRKSVPENEDDDILTKLPSAHKEEKKIIRNGARILQHLLRAKNRLFKKRSLFKGQRVQQGSNRSQFLYAERDDTLIPLYEF
jgi:hypothetical protein